MFDYVYSGVVVYAVKCFREITGCKYSFMGSFLVEALIRVSKASTLLMECRAVLSIRYNGGV